MNYQIKNENTHAGQDKQDKIIVDLLKKLESSPEDIEIYNDLGIVYYSRKEYEKAFKIYCAALNIKPDYAIGHNNIGIIYFELKQYDNAIKAYQRAIEIKPDYCDVYNNMANTYFTVRRYKEAVESYKKAIEIKPDFALAHNNLGLTYHAMKEYNLAIECYKRALTINPNYSDSYNNLGFVYNDIGEYDLAINVLKKAVELNPQNAQAYNNFGISYYGKRQLDHSMINYKKAISLKPDLEESYNNLSAVYMIQGDFKTGLDLYEWRFYKNSNSKDKICLVEFDQPKWNGRDIKDKTIYVYYEQGFGDTLMFSRYLPLLSNMGAKVLFKPQKAMKELFRFNNLSAEIINFDIPDKEIQFDEHIPLASLARIFKTDLSNIPYAEGYLKADPVKANAYKEKYFNNDKFKIGIFWQGNPKGMKSRATKLEYFLRFAEIENVMLYSLQKGFGIEQLKEIPEGINNVVDLGSTFNDYSDTAAAIENLDFIISIDTSIIHLAGAMGKPVWMMLHWENEWRWLINREDTPWYKSIRLFRQKTRNDWEELFARVKNELSIVCLHKAIELNPEDLDNYNNLAICHYSLKRYEEAIKAYQGALKINPRYIVGYNNIGTMYFSLKDYNNAIECYKKAIELNPKYIDAHNNIANTYNVINMPDKAIEYYKKLTSLTPADSNVYKNLGISYYNQKKYKPATEALKKALTLDPNNVDALYRLGLMEFNKKNYDKAIEFYLKVLKLNPNHIEALNSIGLTFANKKEYKKAIECYKRAIRLNPNVCEAYNDLGVCYQNIEEYEKAINIYKEGLRLNPNYVEIYCNLAVSYCSVDKYDVAEDCYKKALAIKPDHVNAFYNMGVLYTRLNKLSEAAISYKKAIDLDPDPKIIFNFANNQLLSGNYEEGFKLYEQRVHLEKYKLLRIPDFAQPKWDGKPIPDKKLLIYPEQGLGDSIQFARYIHQLPDLVGEVLFRPQAGLEKLFRDSNIPADIINASIPLEEIEFDMQCSIMSLPHILNARVDNIPLSGKYIYSDPERVALYKEKYFQNNSLKVGIKWQGNPLGNKNRQVNLDQFYKLLNIKGLKLYSLQKDSGSEQIKDKPDEIEIINLGETFNDFADTAAAIENLDILVSIDTSVAHLAGAMEKPTFIVLPFDPEWRWLLDREDTPWYKSVRLFRQKKHFQWEDVFDRIYNELDNMVKSSI